MASLLLIIPGATLSSPGLESALATSTSAPGRYVILGEQSEIRFSVRHLGLNRVRGSFSNVTGTVIVDNSMTIAATAEVDVASIDTGIGKRDRHLLSDDFLEVEQWQSITFQSDADAVLTSAAFLVPGKLSIKGVELPISIDASNLSTDQDRQDGVLRLSGTTTINRRDFGVTGGASGKLIGRKVRVTLDIVAQRDSLN